MQGTQQRLALGLRHHREGRLAQAAALYERVVRDEPGNADAIQLTGVLAHVSGQHERAAALIARAVELRPHEAGYQNNLGEALRALRRFDEAVAAYETALRLRPGFAEARNNLGNALFDQGRFEEAVAAYQRVVDERPGIAPWWVNLGTALLRCGDRAEEAATAYQRALQFDPQPVEAHNMLGMAQRALGRYDAAELCLRHALSLRGDYTPALNNLGIVLKERGRFDDAEKVLRQAIALRSDFAEAHDTLGTTRLARGDHAGAVAAFDNALRARPAFHQARWNRALALLASGDYTSGFGEYQARFEHDPTLARRFDCPRCLKWAGEPLEGRRIFIHAEQGLGDTIQFARFIEQVGQRGGRVTVECQPALVELMASVRGVEQAIPAGESLPPFDLHAPLLSLPHLLGTTVDTLPNRTPYLQPATHLAEACRRLLVKHAGLCVGINWQGNPRFHDDRFRSIPLRDMLPLADVPGVTLFSLQHNHGREQLETTMPILDGAALFADTAINNQNSTIKNSLSLTAAAITALDLVITSDTMIAHLAGALGKPVWVLLSSAPDWRYQLDAVTNPWYPTMRLFRQPRFSDWAGTVSQAVTALRQLAAVRAAA